MGGRLGDVKLYCYDMLYYSVVLCCSVVLVCIN